MCRRLKSEFLERPLGRVHEDRLGEGDYRGPFSVVQCDLAGNWSSYDARVKRETLTLYIATFYCVFTRNIHIETLTSLSTDALLGALSRLSSLRGKVYVVYADCGRNFLGGSNRETVDEDNLDVYHNYTNEVFNDDNIGELNRKGSIERMTFKLQIPFAHWRTGGAERSIRAIRQQYKILRMPRRCFSLLEYSELFHRIANILNHRAVGVSVSTGDIISPADLLFGMREDWVRLSFKEDKLTERHFQVQECLDRWRESFQRASKEFLIRKTKWKYPQDRNLETRDIVLILDKVRPKLAHNFVLGEVIAAEPDRDGKVRKVRCAYRVPDHNTQALCDRDVRGLCLLVSRQEREEGSGYLCDLIEEYDEDDDDDDDDAQENDDDDEAQNEDENDDDENDGDDEDRDSEGQLDLRGLDDEENEEAAEEEAGGAKEEERGEKRNPFQELKEWEQRQREAAQAEGRRLKKP